MTNRKRTTVGDVMAATMTDGWIVTQHGKVLEEHYYGGMVKDTHHLLMSVSKSLIGMVAGALFSDGVLDVEAELTSYVPLPTPDTPAPRCATCSTCDRAQRFPRTT